MDEEDADDLAKIESAGPKSLPTSTDALFGTHTVVVPGALVPVQCSVEHDYAVYVEPGVWVHHRL